MTVVEDQKVHDALVVFTEMKLNIAKSLFRYFVQTHPTSDFMISNCLKFLTNQIRLSFNF